MGRKYVATMWLKSNDDRDKIFGFVVKGTKYFSVYIGDDTGANKNAVKIVGNISVLYAAVDILKKRVEEFKVPYYIYVSANEYYRGDHCSQKYESYNAEGNREKSYYISDGSHNKYLFYQVGIKDVLYGRVDD